MSRLTRPRQSAPAGVPSSESSVVPSVPRLLAVAFGSILLGSYLQVFYRVVDVVGGVPWFGLSVGSALLLASALARWGTPRWGLALGGFLLAAGVVAYLLSVPSVLGELFTVQFAVSWLSYLSGLTVLQFERADVWAIVVAPGPAFLSWFLLLSRRYAASALAGGLMLAFFASTGDASPTTTLVGMTSLLGVLGAGQADRNGGVLEDVIQVGLVLSLAAVAARTVHVVPRPAEQSAAVGGGDSGGSDDPALSGDLENADEEAHLGESISLSPVAYFSVEADRPAAWRVGAYDRFAGDDWVRTGESAPYGGPLEPPPGDWTRLEQSVGVHQSVATLPAAWKPVRVAGEAAGDVQVTDLDGLVTGSQFSPGDRFAVTSAVPDVDAEGLRGAGGDYPEGVLDRYLQLPGSTSERVRRLAEQVTDGEPTPYDAAVAVRRWLIREKSYDLTVEGPSGDVADAFLFTMDRGYCIHFATAMAVLLRAVDVPARFVLGYTTGQSVGEDRWVVRGFDSHAWVEVFFPGDGWVGFDPTPSRPRQDARTDVLERAREADRDDVDVTGSATVSARRLDTSLAGVERNVTVSEDMTAPTNVSGARAETSIGENASPTAPGDRPNGAEPNTLARTADDLATWVGERDRVALLAGAASVTLGLHWIGAFERGYRTAQLKWQRSTDSPRRDVERAYHRFELLLARRYRDRTPGETRRRYLAAAGYRDRRRARRVVELYERAVYGHGVTRAEADEAIRIVGELINETG